MEPTLVSAPASESISAALKTSSCTWSSRGGKRGVPASHSSCCSTKTAPARRSSTGGLGGETDDIGAAFDLFIEALESLNYQLKKVVESRGDFPNGVAAVKMLWLAICNIEKLARERGRSRDIKCKVGGRLVEG